MIWGVSKTTTSVFVLISTASPSRPFCDSVRISWVGWTHHVSLVALGGSKGMHEFLVLHYMATDSAEEWDFFLDTCVPQCTWVRAGSRRALALHMYNKCHVAPSHRRFAHPSWIAGMKLMLDLLLGARKHRYLRSRPFDHLPAQVYVSGFSAGSYSGICLLHLLWNMPHVQVGGILGGIALPPALLHGIQPDHGAQLMVMHPRDETLNSLPCKFCIVDGSTTELREHFGASQHSHGHWIDINMPHGRYPLWHPISHHSFARWCFIVYAWVGKQPLRPPLALSSFSAQAAVTERPALAPSTILLLHYPFQGQ